MYMKILDAATRHRDAVMKGDFESGEMLLKEQETLMELISSAEPTEFSQQEKDEISGVIKQIQLVYGEIRSKLEEEVQARTRDILAAIGQKKALTAYAHLGTGKDACFDRTK